MQPHEETLRRLAVRDNAYVDRLLRDDGVNECASRLDAKEHALVRVAALVAVDASPPSYMDAIDAARAAGASSEEIVGCLIAVLPTVGVERVVSAAPKVGLALGYDVDAALEARRDPRSG
jgi:alkylhydroperoxidase/carboxymuconolactone decarboxylase family protein YurZ